MQSLIYPINSKLPVNNYFFVFSVGKCVIDNIGLYNSKGNSSKYFFVNMKGERYQKTPRAKTYIISSKFPSEGFVKTSNSVKQSKPKRQAPQRQVQLGPYEKSPSGVESFQGFHCDQNLPSYSLLFSHKEYFQDTPLSRFYV